MTAGEVTQAEKVGANKYSRAASRHTTPSS